MTTLLQEFEDWLKDQGTSAELYCMMQDALEKLEELKKKYNVV